MFSFGFYNSKDGDRKYNATHFGKLFDGIITDGVLAGAPAPLNSMFSVEPKEQPNLQVTLNPGKAWLMHTWNILDSKTTITFNQATANYKRTDAIVLEVNNNYTELEGSYPRTNSIKIVEGPNVLISSADAPPALTQVFNANNTERRIWQYPIAYVTIYGSNYNGGTAETNFEAKKIKAININGRVDPANKPEDPYVGSTWIPLVTGATMNLSLADYLPISQWQGIWADMMLDDEAVFNSWFDHIAGVLSDDVAGEIMDYIDNPSTGKLAYGTTEPVSLNPGQIYFQIEE